MTRFTLALQRVKFRVNWIVDLELGNLMKVNLDNRAFVAVAVMSLFCLAIGCGLANDAQGQNSASKARLTKQDKAGSKPTDSSPTRQVKPKVETASFGAGCFWCVEAVFQELEGVSSVKSGYMGGKIDNPTYDQVCRGDTGHAEICQIKFDPAKITFSELLEVFWKTHDPTTLNRQGNDRGTQYRSAVFYHSPDQKELATKYKQKLNELKAYPNPVVTEITKASKFYPAENYHDNYFKRNPNGGYCQMIIRPKMDKFRKAFADKLKKN